MQDSVATFAVPWGVFPCFQNFSLPQTGSGGLVVRVRVPTWLAQPRSHGLPRPLILVSLLFGKGLLVRTGVFSALHHCKVAAGFVSACDRWDDGVLAFHLSHHSCS